MPPMKKKNIYDRKSLENESNEGQNHALKQKQNLEHATKIKNLSIDTAPCDGTTSILANGNLVDNITGRDQVPDDGSLNIDGVCVLNSSGVGRGTGDSPAECHRY